MPAPHSCTRPSSGWATRLLVALALLLRVTQALSMNYCSSQLTADEDPVENPYQSNGACSVTCKGYAFVVLQRQKCWCSNYAPGDTTDTGSCNQNCPGFPSEKCGNPGQGLYAYFQIGNNVAGTQGVSSAEPEPTQQAAPDTVTVLDTVTTAPSPSVSVVTSLVSSQAAAATTEEVTSPTTVAVVSTTTWSATPFASVTTVLGSVQTVLITPSPPPQPAQTNTTIINAQAPESFWSDTGKVAGTFVAVALVIIAAVAGAIFLMVRRMRRRSEAIAVGSNADEDLAPGSGGGGGANPYMVDRRRSNLTLATSPAAAAGLTRGNSNEKPGSQENTPATLSRRTSMPLVHDQRLNPAALWHPSHENGSHVSVASFRDDQDYSRPVLHVRNPDHD